MQLTLKKRFSILGLQVYQTEKRKQAERINFSDFYLYILFQQENRRFYSSIHQGLRGGIFGILNF